MKNFARKAAGALAAAVLLSLLSAGLCAAADTDQTVELFYEHDGTRDLLGTAFYRADALWAPAQALRVMGAVLTDGPNNKGFYINVQDPAQAFDSPQLAQLAGQSLSLYFPSLSVSGISYFNVSGMSALTNLNFRRENGSVVFTEAKNPKGYDGPLREKPQPISGKLTMTWEYVSRDNPNLAASPKTPGLDVVSPTWFNLMDTNGGMANRASAAYTKAAHERGWRVWGLVSNSFNAAMTAGFLKNQRAQDLFIARLIVYSKIYDLDGINVDFEGFNETDRDAYTRFIAKLAQALRGEGLAVSVDVFVPANTKSSRSHNRAELSKYVDYVMLMAYDEHWRTSPRSGSVASLSWVTRAVEGALAEGVPAEKLVLGVPFYMRRWEETGSGSNLKVKSFTLTMAESESLAQRTGAALKWLEAAGQHYFAYAENGKTYKVWVENADSIGRKLDLVVKHGLAGMAGWRRGHEKPEVWNKISQMMGKI
ncbi:MAG: glycosyl hydrolase family 18 protein [Cloacibacillus sp.]